MLTRHVQQLTLVLQRELEWAVLEPVLLLHNRELQHYQRQEGQLRLRGGLGTIRRSIVGVYPLVDCYNIRVEMYHKPQSTLPVG